MNISEKLAYYLFGAGVVLFPAAAFARTVNSLWDIIGVIEELFRAVIPVIFLLALIYFLWGAARYIYKSNDATAREEGSKMMLYGIIALFVMVGIWGIVGLLGGTFGIETVIPQFGGSGSSSGTSGPGVGNPFSTGEDPFSG